MATNDFIASGQDGWSEFTELGAPELLDVDIYAATVRELIALEEPLRRPRRQVYHRAVTRDVVGNSERALAAPAPKPRFPVSSRAGGWVASVMAATAGTSIGCQLTADVGAAIPKGPVTKQDLHAVSPFGSDIVKVALSGKELREWIDRSLLLGEGDEPDRSAKLEFSGVTIEWRRSGEDRFVDRVLVGGELLDEGSTYDVATTDYLSRGAGGLLRPVDGQPAGGGVYDALVAELSRLTQAKESVTPVEDAYRQTGSWSERGVGILGLVVLMAIAWLLSTNRRSIQLRPVVWGLGLQFCLAYLILETAWGQQLFVSLKNVFIKVMDFSLEGSAMVFGPLSSSALVGGAFGGWDFIFFTQILGTIVLVSTLMAILYHIGVMQLVVYCFAKLMQVTMRTSGAESLASAANVFVGQTEAPLVIRPYLLGLTSSEILSMMTGGMATVAGGVLAAYVGFGIDAGHLLAASVMSAPAALAIAKVLVPETEKSSTSGHVPFEVKRVDSNVIDATCRGANEGFKLALNVMAMLIAVVAVVALLNYGIDWLYQLAIPTAWIEAGDVPPSISFQWLLGKIFQPLAWLLGIPWSEADAVGGLLGTRMVLNEFLAYMQLAGTAADLSPRSVTIATYALCGFANFSSIAIQIGGISALEEGLRPRLAKLGLLSMIGGTLATMMTACIAGVFL